LLTQPSNFGRIRTALRGAIRITVPTVYYTQLKVRLLISERSLIGQDPPPLASDH
jgi:hypothetical protein